MDLFLMLQVFFDAVLLFGILFLFHYSVHHTQKKKEESDVLKEIQIQEMKENLQELLMTLKQLGKEVSENIQEQVRDAETKTDVFKKTIAKLQKDLSRVSKLSEAVTGEIRHLEEKSSAIETAKKNTLKAHPPQPMDRLSALPEVRNREEKKRVEKASPVGFGFDGSEKTMGFSSGLVREIYKMADGKADINEIVQLTKLSRAEVQLILNLRGNRFTTPN